VGQRRGVFHKLALHFDSYLAAKKHANKIGLDASYVEMRFTDAAPSLDELATDAQKLTEKNPDGSIKVEAVMDVENVATTVLHMAGLPLDANVPFITVMATKMPFMGRG